MINFPRFAWGHFPLYENLSLLGFSNQQELVAEARFWGGFWILLHSDIGIPCSWTEWRLLDFSYFSFHDSCLDFLLPM
nr:endoplasmic reticulum metallopeptidase 1 isoform X1 [Ipomoea batatas]